MAQAAEIEASDRVLEIGTGSGYAAAILAMLASEVFSIERHRELAEQAEERLHGAGFGNVTVKVGDVTRGWLEKAHSMPSSSRPAGLLFRCPCRSNWRSGAVW
jgi:protein-L-isoaspartate O-methyltransferase